MAGIYGGQQRLHVCVPSGVNCAALDAEVREVVRQFVISVHLQSLLLCVGGGSLLVLPLVR